MKVLFVRRLRNRDWSVPRSFRYSRVSIVNYVVLLSGVALWGFVSCSAEDYRASSVAGTNAVEPVTEIVPANVSRVHGGPEIPKGPGWPPSIAILDTGIDTTNSDLNVVGGFNCATDDIEDWHDSNGHGTSLAGVVGAKQNGEGIIGVAPGAELYAIRLFADETLASEESVLCGLRWVDENSSRIDVVLTAFNRSDESAADETDCTADSLRQMICRLHEAGITVVSAAGNQKADASEFVPAKLSRVISVGAIVDFDGVDGGLGSPTCGPGIDDDIADFSNRGASVDIYAPGVCIQTTRLKSLRDSVAPSGTSLAAAHVAAAAAIYMACHVDATPDEVKELLLDSGEMVSSDGMIVPTIVVISEC
ncbi:S8 family serine peptidase [Candidatus Poriferisodalis sp.]|uniref:S8 family serine peptidase n=1 Tax=Candidatus Poriferisodalis sp. TaxID=3101277 RepID=UPI003B012B1B